jgi:hypothetical protein
VPKIRFVGLFDTVGSFGWPGNNVNIGIRMDLPSIVLNAAQAVSHDENRSKFPLTGLNLPGAGQTFSQEIFAGDHSDIGGGWGATQNLLSAAPLQHIWSAGISAGVPFGPLPQRTYLPNTTPHDRTGDFPYYLDSNPPRDFTDIWTGTRSN